jgi:hypothetical protein
LGLPSSIAVGDFTGDGIPDLALANGNGSSDNVAILQGDGSGGFTNAANSPFPANGNPTHVVVGDFNGDGQPDLAIANPFQGTVTELLNTTGVASGRAASPTVQASPTTACPTSAGPTSTGRTPAGPTSARAAAPVLYRLALRSHTIRARQGLTLEVTLSSAASIVVEFKKAVVRYRHGHGHKTLTSIGSTTLAGHAGVNRFTIRRVAGRVLRRGHYTLVVFAERAGERSVSHTTTLTVKR